MRKQVKVVLNLPGELYESLNDQSAFAGDNLNEYIVGLLDAGNKRSHDDTPSHGCVLQTGNFRDLSEVVHGSREDKVRMGDVSGISSSQTLPLGKPGELLTSEEFYALPLQGQMKAIKEGKF